MCWPHGTQQFSGELFVIVVAVIVEELVAYIYIYY